MKFLSVLSSLALVALAIPATAGSSAGSFTNCESTVLTEFTVSIASLTPEALCPGQNMCFTVSGQLSQAIFSGAKLEIKSRFLGKI